MATVKVKSEGKSGFLKEFFVEHPHAGKKAIDEAWRGAGNDGSISDSLISKVRSGLRLTGQGRGKAKAKESAVAGKRPSVALQSDARGKGSEATVRGRENLNGRTATTGAERPARSHRTVNDRTSVLIRLESEIDDLLHEIRMAGGLPEFEETLRTARRILVRSHGE